MIAQSKIYTLIYCQNIGFIRLIMLIFKMQRELKMSITQGIKRYIISIALTARKTYTFCRCIVKQPILTTQIKRLTILFNDLI